MNEAVHPFTRRRCAESAGINTFTCLVDNLHQAYRYPWTPHHGDEHYSLCKVVAQSSEQFILIACYR